MMFKKTIFVLSLGVALCSVAIGVQAAPSSSSISSFATCSSDCVTKAQEMLAEISVLEPSASKDALLLAYIKALAAVAVADPAVSVQLAGYVAEASAQTTTVSAETLGFVNQIQVAMAAGTPGTATASVDAFDEGDAAVSSPDDFGDRNAS